MTAPHVSIVVPTRDRRESLGRLLRTLSVQSPVDGGFEVIIVADGCRDSTARHVRTLSLPFDVHVLELPPSGPSASRNCGAALATGEILIFLDDDVEPEPQLVRAHAEFQASHARAVGLGYLPPVVVGGLFGATLRVWWEGMFDGPRRAWHRYTYRDLLTGNFSIARADFEALGGFDPALRCHEDWDFGYRAIRQLLELRFLPRAVAAHHDATDVERALRRKFDEGVADVHLARKYPELIITMPLGRRSVERMLRSKVARLAWHHADRGDRLVRAAHRILRFYERWNLRFRWRALLDRMLGYWYWRGVASALGMPERLGELIAQAPAAQGPGLEVDLAAGIDSAVRLVDARRPRSVRLTYAARVLGEVPDIPGAERLRSVHLRRAIARELSVDVRRALTESAHAVVPPAFVTPAV